MDYTVAIMGRRYSADSLQDASAKVASIRDNMDYRTGQWGYGASEMGAEFPVRDGDEVIAIVSYNGRVWTPETDWKQRNPIEVAA